MGMFAAKASATFGVWVPAGPWEAVRIGLPWHPAGAREDSPPTVAWSPELTQQEILQQAGVSALAQSNVLQQAFLKLLQ